MKLRSTVVVTAVLALVGAGPSVRRYAAAPRFTPVDSVPVLATFLAGSWHCRGGTPGGKVLESDVVFTMMLGARWLSSEHTDVPPGRYHALSLWPTDTSRRAVLSTVYDNFGGARRFFGQWGADSLVWTRDTTESGAQLESFTYRRASDHSYWYAWHVRRTPGGAFALGDSATCLRSPTR